MATAQPLPRVVRQTSLRPLKANELALNSIIKTYRCILYLKTEVLGVQVEPFTTAVLMHCAAAALFLNQGDVTQCKVLCIVAIGQYLLMRLWRPWAQSSSWHRLRPGESAKRARKSLPPCSRSRTEGWSATRQERSLTSSDPRPSSTMRSSSNKIAGGTGALSWQLRLPLCQAKHLLSPCRKAREGLVSMCREANRKQWRLLQRAGAQPLGSWLSHLRNTQKVTSSILQVLSSSNASCWTHPAGAGRVQATTRQVLCICIPALWPQCSSMLPSIARQGDGDPNCQSLGRSPCRALWGGEGIGGKV